MKEDSEVMDPSSLRHLLGCPQCMHTMYPPVYQCDGGHVICSRCKQYANNRCPKCRHELGIRCLALEKLAELIGYSCNYHALGCEEILQLSNKLEHEKACKFRPFDCPHYAPGCGDCEVTGSISSLMSHLKIYHERNVCTHTNNSSISVIYEIPNAAGKENEEHPIHIYSLSEKYFCLKFEPFEEEKGSILYIAFVHFMGEVEEALKYRYSLEITKGERRATWQGFPRSIRESHSSVRDSLDGLVILENMVLDFSTNSELNLTGKIWEKDS